MFGINQSFCVRYKGAVLIALIVCMVVIVYFDDLPRDKNTKVYRLTTLVILLTAIVGLSVAYSVGSMACSLSEAVDEAVKKIKQSDVG